MESHPPDYETETIAPNLTERQYIALYVRDLHVEISRPKKSLLLWRIIAWKIKNSAANRVGGGDSLLPIFTLENALVSLFNSLAHRFENEQKDWNGPKVLESYVKQSENRDIFITFLN